MNAPARIRLVFVPVLLALLAGSAPALGDVQKAKTHLVRFDPADPEALAPDANARGTLQIDTKTSTGRDRLTLVIKKVTKGLVYDFYMEDPEDIGGELVMVGTLEGGGTQKLKLDTDKGDMLPFGETSFDNLIGLAVQVRVGSAVYLSSVVPAFDASKKGVSAKQDLGLALGGPDPNAVGKLEFKSKPSADDQRVLIKLNMLDFSSHQFFLWIETEPDSGVFMLAGVFTQKGSNGGRYDHHNTKGEPLPFGELTALGFAGRKLEVRDQNDVAYLSALIPQLN